MVRKLPWHKHTAVKPKEVDILILTEDDKALLRLDLEMLASMAPMYDGKNILEYNAPVKIKLIPHKRP